jgi:hypothetical protein
MRIVGVAVLVALVAGLTACGSDSASPKRGDKNSAQLIDLTRVDQLRSQFMRDRGHPRVLLLLSPT